MYPVGGPADTSPPNERPLLANSREERSRRGNLLPIPSRSVCSGARAGTIIGHAGMILIELKCLFHLVRIP